jgi:DNA-binding transcriptional ArsR family regulator
MSNDKIKLPHQHDSSTCQFLKSMPDQKVFDNVAETFNIISDSSRVKILWLLCHCEECVTNIAVAVGMSPPAVSHHLRVLKQNQLISYRKDGKEVYYKLADTELAKQVHRIVDSMFNIKCNI